MPTPTEPRLRLVHGIQFDGHLRSSILRAQARWILVSAALAVLLSMLTPGLRLDLSLSLCVAIGLFAARPLPVRGLATVLAAVLSTEILATQAVLAWTPLPQASHFVSTTVYTVEGQQIMAAASILGLGVGWMEPNGHRLWRAINGSLIAATGAAIGWWVGLRVWPTAGASQLIGCSMAMAAPASLALWVRALRPWSATRIPSQRTIVRELAEAYRPPCIEALRLDQTIEAECEDRHCRDGLGEVAAWVYRLQWILQRMDRELSTSPEMDLKGRLERAEAAVSETTDRFTRDRRRATLSQLNRLSAHLDRIRIERERALALVDFALVNLEEARAQLVLARLQPGAHAPPSVHEVLTRLRAWSQQQEAEQSSLREMACMA